MTCTPPDWVPVFIMVQFKIVDGERKITAPCKDLQLADRIGLVGIFDFVPDGEQLTVSAKILLPN